MLTNLTTVDSLTAVISGAVTTTAPTFLAVYATGTDPVQAAVGALDGVTAATLVVAPLTGRRDVMSVAIYNGDSVPVTVTIARVVNGTSYNLVKRTLAVGDRLQLDGNGAVVFPSATTPSGVGVPSLATVTAAEQGIGGLQTTVLTLNAVPVTVANTTGVSFGGTKIYDFPAGRILVLGVTAANISFGLTSVGNVTPIDGTMGGDLSLGTTPPSDGTLTVADVDLLPSTSIDPISGGVAGAALAASAQFDGTATPKDMYFNILIDDADVGNAASDILLVTATITCYWINLGDY